MFIIIWMLVTADSITGCNGQAVTVPPKFLQTAMCHIKPMMSSTSHFISKAADGKGQLYVLCNMLRFSKLIVWSTSYFYTLQYIKILSENKYTGANKEKKGWLVNHQKQGVCHKILLSKILNTTSLFWERRNISKVAAISSYWSKIFIEVSFFVLKTVDYHFILMDMNL